MADQDDFFVLTSDDERARRLCALAVAFSNARSPLSSPKIHTTYYPDLNDGSFRKKFARDREQLVECGFVILPVGSDSTGVLWQVDTSSFADSSSLSSDDALMLDVLCTQLVADPSFAYREELRLALAKIDHAFGTLTAARLAPEDRDRDTALRTMLSCMEQRRMAKVTYVDASGTESLRVVAPYGHFGLRNNIYFVCAQHDADGHTSMRTLRTDRIKSSKSTSRTFEIPADFAVDDFIRLPFQIGPTVATATFAETDHSDADFLLDLDRYAQRDGNGLHTVNVSNLEAAARWAIAAGIRPISPQSLLDLWRDTLHAAETSVASPMPSVTPSATSKAESRRGRRGSTSETRELIALVGSLESEGATLSVLGVSARLGIQPERAQKLINLLLTACVDTDYQLPLTLESDDIIVLSRSQGITGRPVRLTQAEAYALISALDELGFSDDDPLRADVLAAFGPSHITEQEIRTHMDASALLSSSETLEACSRAISSRGGLSFSYCSLSSKLPERRRVLPQAVRHVDDFWYLDAFDFARNALRTFRLDRMEDVRIFSPAADELPKTHLARNERTVEIAFFDRSLLDVLEWPGLAIQGACESTLVATLPFFGGEWLPRHLAACGARAVTSDDELAALTRTVASELAQS